MAEIARCHRCNKALGYKYAACYWCDIRYGDNPYLDDE